MPAAMLRSIPALRRLPPALGLLLLLPSGGLTAQSLAERAQLEAFRTLLDESSSDQQVRSASVVSPAGQIPAVRELRRGFAALRLGELRNDRGQLDEAILHFDAAQVLKPRWPYPWYGLALAKLALHGRDALVKSSRNQPDGLSYFEGYTRAFAEVFERDPAFPPALAQLRQTLAGQGDKHQPEDLMVPLRRIGLGPLGTADDALILARDFRRRDRGDSALMLLDLYVQRGGDSGVGALERARTLAFLGSPTMARETYLAGSEQVSALMREAYRADLIWIADSTELARFDRTPDDSLAGWIAEFWRWRDVHELRTEGERLREHLRRWAYVDGQFRVVSPERRTQFARVWATLPGPCNRGDYYYTDNILPDSVLRPADGRRRERLYDDRAYIYMRHGEPARRIGGTGRYDPPNPLREPVPSKDDRVEEDAKSIQVMVANERLENARANETWLYWFGGGARLFSFEGSFILGTGAPTTMVVEPLPDPAWLELRGQVDPQYFRLAHALDAPSAVPFACKRTVQYVAAKSRSDAGVALRSDSYTLLFPKELNPVVQMYALGRPDLGTGRILVVFALPGQQLSARPLEEGDPRGVWYPVAVRVGATDSTQRVARAFDTVRQFVAADTLLPGSHLTGLLELPVPAGNYRVGTAFFQPGGEIGGGVTRDNVDLRSPAGGLYLSDVVLGRQGSGLAWSYRGERVPLNPLGAFPRNEAAQVFYELSGATPGRSYVTAIELSPIEAKTTEPSIRLRFTEIAERDELVVRRTLGLSQLEKGQYRLTVEVVEEGSSRRVRRERYLTVLNGPP